MSIKGKKRYNNGVVTRYFSDSEEIPEGFVLGVLPKDKERLQLLAGNRKGSCMSDNTKELLSNSHKGLVYIYSEINDEYKQVKSEELQHYISQGWVKKHPSQTEETRLKISESKKGIPSKTKGNRYSEESLLKRKLTIEKNYGSLEEYYKGQQYKSKNSKLERYGDPNYNNLSKRQQTISNIPNYYESRSIKTNETIIRKYGSSLQKHLVSANTAAINAGLSSIEEYYKYWRYELLHNVNSKNSKLEKRFETFLKSQNIHYINRYRITTDTLSHEFDFAIFKDNEISMLVDCDGRYYHGYKDDFNGKSVNSYSDDYRSILVPKGVKFVQLVEGPDTEQEAYSEVLSLFSASYEDYKESIFNWCREVSFPYPSYNATILQNSWKSLLQSDVSKFSLYARYGEKLILNFHHSLWHARKLGKVSPYEAWKDDNLLRKCIENRIIYKGTNLDRSRVLTGFSVSGIAPKVSLFSAYLAKYITEKYLKDFEVVFDPFSGYSGRMLGVCSLGKRYIGQDINTTTVSESLELVNFLNLDASLYVRNSLESSNTYECLFTCSPYKNKEIWEGTPETKYTCDEWIDKMLERYSCKKYIFVVDNTDKYKDNIVETLEYKSHFSKSKEYVVCIENS